MSCRKRAASSESSASFGRIAGVDRFDLHFERALPAEHRLDASETRATEEAREAEIETAERVLRERGLRGVELVAHALDARARARRMRSVGAQQLGKIGAACARRGRGRSRLAGELAAEPRFEIRELLPERQRA